MNWIQDTTFVKNLNKLEAPSLTLEEREMHLRLLFNENQIMDHLSESDRVLTNSQLYSDLELFESKDPVVKYLDHTITPFGQFYLPLLLQSPICNLNTLNQRQNMIKEVSKMPEVLTSSLNQIKIYTDDLLWFWKSSNIPETQNMLDLVYFKTFQSLNDSPQALNTSIYLTLYLYPLIQLLSPLIPVLAMFIVLKYSYPSLNFSQILGIMRQFYHFDGFNLGLLMFWFLIYVYGTYTAITTAIVKYKIIALIHQKLFTATHFLQQTRTLYLTYIQGSDLSLDRNKIELSLHYLESQIKIPTCCHLFDHKGQTLYLYHKLMNNPEFKSHLTCLMQFVGYMDCLQSTAKLSCIRDYSLTRFKDSFNTFKFKDIWHPCLKDRGYITNSSNLQTHRILTGPNAGGKSTYIKNVALLALLSQTLTIGNCKQVHLKPLKLLHTYIHLIDCKGSESLFEAEMNRCFNFLDLLKSLTPDQPGLVIFDELFTSTNFQEGVAGAKAICEEFLKYPNLKSLLTTHYSELTDLETITHGKFKNYKVIANYDPSHKITFNYKLKRGISHQFVALDLLKAKGFHSELIERAKSYLINIF